MTDNYKSESIFNYFIVFEKIDEKFKNEIKCFNVSNNDFDDNKILHFITRDDKVFEYYLENDNEVYEPNIIHELCDQNIIEFFNGLDFFWP